jgi:hypothetical protein
MIDKSDKFKRTDDSCPLWNVGLKNIGIGKTLERDMNAYGKQRNEKHKNFIGMGVWMSIGKI